MNNWDQYQSTPKLLPPTVFERINETNSNSSTSTSITHQTTSSLETTHFSGESQFAIFNNELEKLKTEIRKLHSENESLRHRNKDFVEQAQLYSEVTEHRKISMSALEEIIHKQTREIQTLKCDLTNEKESNQQLEQKLQQALSESEKKLKEQSKQTDSLNEQLKIALNEKQNVMETFNKEIESLKESLNKLSLEKQIVCDENKNLRNYIQNSMPTIKEMTEDRQTYEQEILKLKSKNEILQKENTAIQIRLKSINEILAIQEAQLESNSSNCLTSEKKRIGLLNKWRSKVYELLVQLKSQEISFKQEKNQEEKLIQDCMQKLENESAKNRILENIIEDKKAEISVLSADKTILSEQLSALKETNEKLEKNPNKIYSLQ